ncbi:carbohydrate ABC transporter permease [Psychromonas ossibalaenae]|uniref:carbohydrate ABC transporter permease n=1 Tax=Psychromonas ossibalaenae TaxID=444922 RepID=UPI00035F867F|nr:sugar ABC transporter permease [Psychromonas ossibalaenae]
MNVSAWVKLKFGMPFYIFFGLFFIIPLFLSVYLSFTEYSLTQGGLANASWIGLDNYIRAFGDERFLSAVKNTFIIVIFAVPIQLAASLALALIIESSALKLKKVFNVGYYLPTIASTVAVALMFTFLFKSGGAVNSAVAFIPDNFNWLESTRFAIVPVILMHSWSHLGLYMIIFVGGLKSIPAELYEAADMDGANKLTQLLKITIPSLKPVIFFVFITSMINGFKLYDEVAVMTKNEGGPLDSTLTTVLYIYNTAFKSYEVGYASAMAMIFMSLILTVVFIERKVKHAKS